MLTRPFAAAFAAMAIAFSFSAVAQDLPRTQFKVIGLNSPTVASSVDEVPFWRETQRELRRFRARGSEAHALGRGHEPLHQLGPLHLELVRGAPMRAERRLALYRLDEWGMGVPEEQRAVAAEIIDVFVAVDVPFARACRARGVDRVGRGGTRIVRQACGQYP